MQIDRRRFLKLFSSAALASIGPIEKLAGLTTNQFRSEALNFSFDIPLCWYRPTIEEVRENLRKQVFQEADGDESNWPTPLVAFYRHREPIPEMNPGVWVYADKQQDWMGTPCQFAAGYIDHMITIVKNGQSLMTPKTVKLGGSNVVMTALAHRLVTVEGSEHDVIDFSRIVYHRGHVLWILYEHSRFGPATADSAFASIDATLSFG